ncbi:MAG: hypothetical protein JZU65_01120, partial [Chlorobium sp.]|nr:hypothetical protein [Chlorobium sp.]
MDSFWQRIRDKENSEGSHAQVGESERICALCAVKRFLPRALKQKGRQEELLATVLSGADKFPATTAMAHERYLLELKAKKVIADDEYDQVVELLHNSELNELENDDDTPTPIQLIKKKGEGFGVHYTNRDKYYALLLMDGDKMGDLINGKTFSASWNDVLHPELREKFTTKGFHSNSVLRSKLDEKRILDKKRILNPALHAAISDGLNSFARYGVAPVIHRLG